MSTQYNSQILSAIPTYCPSCPPSLVLSLVQTESSGNQSAVSPKGAIGLFQLMPATAAGLSVDPTTAAGNIQGGLTYLQQLYNQYGDWNEALEAYNEGPGALNAALAAGSTPVAAGYASGILSAAGLDSGAAASLGLPPADSSDTGDLSSTDDSGVLDMLPAGADSSWLIWAAAAALLVGVVAAFR